MNEILKSKVECVLLDIENATTYYELGKLEKELKRLQLQCRHVIDSTDRNYLHCEICKMEFQKISKSKM